MSQDDAGRRAEAASSQKDRARRLEQMVKVATDYELSNVRGEVQILERVERPVLRWSNPLRDTDDGALFIWAGKGRPAAALCIYNYGINDVDYEWQSLSPEPLRATYRQATVWQPEAAKVEFHPIIGDGKLAASSPARRLTQMRSLLGDFAAAMGLGPRRHELRALTQPIYRYGNQTDIIDGAIFAFVQATDPELLLLLEARQEQQQPPTWHWAAARMCSWHLELKYQENVVWTADRWDRSPDDRQPYLTLFHKRTDFTPD